MEQVELVGVGPAVFADVLQIAEANPGIRSNMHGPGKHADAHDGLLAETEGDICPQPPHPLQWGLSSRPVAM